MHGTWGLLGARVFPTAPRAVAGRPMRAARGALLCHAYSRESWGPHSSPAQATTSTMQKLFNQSFVELAQHRHGELSAHDFDRAYRNTRRGMTGTTDTSSSDSDTEHLLQSSPDALNLTQLISAEERALCDALFEFQRITQRMMADQPPIANTSTHLVQGALLIAQLAAPTSSAGPPADITHAQAAVDKLLETMANGAHAELERQAIGSSGGQHTRANGVRLTDGGTNGTARHPSHPGSIVSPQQAAALVQALNRVMYGQQRFMGNTQNFYASDNSILPRVVASRMGSPAALALIYLELARRLGLELEVVLLPSHTFLRPKVPGCTFMVDPFNGGQVCSQQVVEARLNANWGLQAPLISLTAAVRQEHTWRAGGAMALHTQEGSAAALNGMAQAQPQAGAGQGSILASLPVSPPHALLLRLLANLRESYFSPLCSSGHLRWRTYRGGQPHCTLTLWRALWATRFMRAMAPTQGHLVRDEGLALVCLGQEREGGALLRKYLLANPGCEDSDRVQEFIVDRN